MTFDQFNTRMFEEKYGVRDIEIEHEPSYYGLWTGGDLPSEPSLSTDRVRITMSGAGFRQLLSQEHRGDIFSPSFYRTIFDIDKAELPNGTILVAKFDLKKNDVATLSLMAKKLAEQFPNTPIVFVPDGVEIETMGVDALTALRDQLNDIINNLNYDNIMGF